jgi:hypothetical protein
MKKLTYEEMLTLPDAITFARKDDEKMLADCLVRRLYGKKASDFEFGKPFIIEAPIATLEINEHGSSLSSTIASPATLAEMFLQTNRMQEQIADIRKNIATLKSPGTFDMAKNALGAAKRFVKSGFAMVPDEEFNRRSAICKPCEFWDATARMGMGKCLKCGCTSTKLRMATEKCPLDKWLQFDTDINV